MIIGRKYDYKNISEEDDTQILFTDQDELHLTGYKNNLLKKWIFYILNIPLCGTPLLFLNWYPQLIYLKCLRTSLNNAENILIKDINNIYSIHSLCKANIHLDKASPEFQQGILSSVVDHCNWIKYFIHKDIRYVWHSEKMQFYQLRGWDGGVKYMKDILENSHGYSAEEQEILLKIYGENKINVSIPSLWEIFLNEILHPFNLFQIFSVVLWMFNDYVSYAICVIILTGWSVFISLYTAKKHRKSLQNIVQKSSPIKVLVVRKNGSLEEINPSLLVPGDVIQIPKDGCVMPCDALLLHGNCIVNENVLTGESCLVTKIPPTATSDIFNSIIAKRHVLFCGTKVVQTRYYGEGMVTAVTVNTGFSTLKGELIRCLLHPKPLEIKFQEDSIKFIIFLFFIAICGISYLYYISFQKNIPTQTLILDSLDLITIVVPPTLPAALATGIAYSQSRLLSKGIFCISPSKINIFGKLKLMCFDKTGTLTEEGLNLWGLLPCVDGRFGKLIEEPSLLNPKNPLVVAMATCHSLIKIEGKLSGDPLDLNIFNSLNWDLIEPGNDTNRYDLLCPTIVKPNNFNKTQRFVQKDNVAFGNDKTYLDDIISNSNDILKIRSQEMKTNSKSNNNADGYIIDENILPYEIALVREFPFTSVNRCMSVITRELGANHMNLYCKGAPEKIGELCKSETLPINFNHELQVYAAMGFRVIGIAYKQFDQKFNWMKSQRVKREEVENDLIFLGLIIMQNNLKEVSTSVINDLRVANIRCVMITGDNLLTALSVSRECLMVLPGEIVVEVRVTFPNGSESPPTLSYHSLESIEGHEQFNIQDQTGLSQMSFKIESKCYHYALDGKTWELLRTYFSDLIPRIIVKGTIFARMLPEQKTQLVEAFQDLDYIVGMCGDGANDYGAVKAAHVGVSLSEIESSVAAAFTSKVQDVSCVVSLVQEGRCALVSTFVIFKYMTIYSLIQFLSVLIIYGKGICFGNVQFLYIDLIVTSLLAVVIGRTGPSKILVKTRPIARLISFGNIFPLVLQIIVIYCTQILALNFLYKQDWYTPTVFTPETVTVCWENTVVYCVSLFQYLILALVYSKGKPYREPFYKNYGFMVVFVLMTAFTVLLCVFPFRPIGEYFELMPVENDNGAQFLFRFELLTFPIVNLIFSFFIKVLISNRKWLKKTVHFLTRKKESKNRYKRILLDPDQSFVLV